ncbi:MAG TPA: hypothetical protein VGM75_05650 [Pseudonocardiaceae bacterium]
MAAGVASLAVILGLTVAGTTVSVATAVASAPPGVTVAGNDPAGGISVPID